MARQLAPERPTRTEVTRLFCTECGTRNSADSKYCKECGHKVNDGYRTMMLSVDDLRAVDTEQNQERLTKLLDMAFWHNQAGNLDAAVMACDAALVLHPDCTTAHSLLGTLYEKKGDDAKAIDHFEAVVALNPDSAADAAKLELLRRGVHVKAVAPPPVYQWLPPALVGLSWSKVGEKFRGATLPDMPARMRGPLPWVAGGVTGLLVLAGGLALIHPAHTTRTTMYVTRPAASIAPEPSVAASTYGGPATVSGKSLPSPVTLLPGKGPGESVVAVAPAPDPFGETLQPGVKTVPLLRPKQVPHVARVASLGRLPYASGLALPPLSLKAVPLPGEEGIAPAPVSVPSVPQHTVVVSNLGGAAGPSVRTASLPSASVASGDLASHIHITINNSPADNSISISDHATSPSARLADGGGAQDGDSYQQAGLALQQQGDFRGARVAYQKAIRAYKAQIAGGHDADAAGQGLAASQTGLQICEQSQP